MKSSAKKYRRAKPKRQKMSFEKKVLLQSIASAGLMVYCIAVSHTNTAVKQKEYIHSVVNITSTKADIKNMFKKTSQLCKDGIDKGGEYLNKLVYFCDNGFGSTEDTNSIAAAQTNVPHEEKSPKNADTPPAEEQVQEKSKEPEPVFRRPAEGEITSAFGKRAHPLNNTDSIHYGVDIAGNYGDCVISSLPGVVEDTGFDTNLGNYVKIRHSERMQTVYGHLSEILVTKGEEVDANTRIGSIGSSGAATGPHVHLEVRVDGVCVNPADYLPKQ